jgi:glycosyltransferase involved in cell wall biosynthesis
MRAYIISWMGNKKVDRLPMLKKSVEWCKKKDLNPCIIAMEWEEKNFKEFSEVSWVRSDLRLPPGHARNIALNHFYSTEDDYCIILDDDTWIEKGDDLIDTLRKKDMGDVLSVTHASLCYAPYHLHSYHRLKTTNHIITGCFIVKNLRKHYNDELFFNTNFVTHAERGLVYGEDVNFPQRAMTRGYKVYEVYSSSVNASRDIGQTESTWLEKSWKEIHPEGRAEIDRLTALDNIDLNFTEEAIKVEK